MFRRYDRARFLAFGASQVLNTLALLIHGLFISTRGSYGEGETIPMLVVFAGLCLLLAGVAAFKRGCDLGWTALKSIGSFLLMWCFPPAVLVLLAYLGWKQGEPMQNAYGDSPGTMGAGSWTLAIALLAAPWIVLRLAANWYA
jgi:succinate-acetate transporter protein